MNSTEIKALQKSLLEQKGSILNKSSEFKMERTTSTEVSDEGDSASKNVAESISIHLHEKDRRTLYQIERSLAKIADGTYGQCEACGGPVGDKRLLVHPLSTLCISCMEDQESHPFQ